MGTENFSVSRRITRLRWQTPILAFLLVLVHQLIEHTWLIHLPPWQHFASQMLFYGLIGPALAFWVLTSLRKSAQETELAENALRKAHNQLEKSNQRLELLIRVSRRLSEAKDDDSLAEAILELPLTVVPAVGCSLIQYDEQEQPRFALHRGELDPKEFESWVTHLSSIKSSDACRHCSTHWAVNSNSCPLIEPLSGEYPVKKVYCLELERGGRQYGVLNIYLSDPESPTIREKELLETMGLEMSLALESMRLRSMELDALYRVQQSRKLQDFHDELEDVLHHVVVALDVSGGILFFQDTGPDIFYHIAQAGLPIETAANLVKAMAKSALETEEPFIINSFEQIQMNAKDPKSLLVAPLYSAREFIGGLVLWSKRKSAFSQRHIRLLSSVAGQIALLIENHRLYLQAEHNAAMAERARLVREIHDGLAQSLGYMQLRIAQINRWIEMDRIHAAKPALKEFEKQLDEVYIDAREAIDQLRLRPGKESFTDLLEKVYLDFKEACDISLTTCQLPAIDLVPNVQDHVLRILQEALGNIRKHSRASSAWLEWEQDGKWLLLKVRDNGRGFVLEDVPTISHYGLRVMQERAELLGGKLEIISGIDMGTQVLLHLPINQKLREAAR